MITRAADTSLVWATLIDDTPTSKHTSQRNRRTMHTPTVYAAVSAPYRLIIFELATANSVTWVMAQCGYDSTVGFAS